VIVCPFSDTAPDLALADGLAAAVSVKLISPCPDAGETWSHGAWLVIVHPHSRAAVTVA
jgi:hypothetical protein